MGLTNGKRWVVGARNESHADHLGSRLNLPPIVAQLLINRGLGNESDALQFLNPESTKFHSPELLPDFELAAQAILDARERKAKIFIHGDYDADGVTSTAIYSRFLRAIGCVVEDKVPHRLADGYGISKDSVDQAIESGADLLLTCDCGIGSVAEVDYANEKGLKVVITDHHLPGPELPRAIAVVNPKRADSIYPFAELSGAGVAFKVCQGLTEILKLPLDKFMPRFADLATLGTVADVVELRGENRKLVRMGLEAIHTSAKPGIKALIKFSYTAPPSHISARDISLRIAPRLNAPGRIDDAELALRLLLTQDEHEADDLAKRLEQFNMDRRGSQQIAIDAGIKQVDEGQLANQQCLFVPAPETHPGIIGLVAGRLAERYGMPVWVATFVPDRQLWKASGRSVPGVNLSAMVKSLAPFAEGGGHEGAAGMSFSNEHLAIVERKLQDYMKEHHPSLEKGPYVQVECWAELAELPLSTILEIERLQPFGCGNPEPVFAAKSMKVVEAIPTRTGDHIRLTLKSGDSQVAAMLWNAANRINELSLGTLIDVAFTVSVNEFRNTRTAQWFIRDFQASELG